MPGTVNQFISALQSQIGTPYEFGGSEPGGFDCSGLVYWAAGQCGLQIERTSEEQWATVAHVANPEIGDIIFFEVPSDEAEDPSQTPPQHEGVYLSPNRMIEAPHTGGFVQYATIPNYPGERIMGYGRLPLAGQVLPPEPKPPEPVTPTEEDGMATADPISGGEWISYEDGSVDAYDGAPYLGGLNNHPDWHAGTPADPCVGMAYWQGDKTEANGLGYVLFTRAPGQKEASVYRFPRSGKYIKG